MSELFSGATATDTANRLLQESVDIQRSLSTMVSARKLHTVATTELQDLLTTLPAGLSDAIPVEFTPEERALLFEVFSELAAVRDPFMPDTADLVSVLGSFVLPWVRDVGLKRRIESAKEQRYQYQAEWKKRAESTIKLPFKLTIDEQRGQQCGRSRPLLFVAPESLRERFTAWLWQGMMKENRGKKFLVFDAPSFNGDIPFQNWAGQLHMREFVDRLRIYEKDTAPSMVDILFNPDLFAGQMEQGSMSLATYVHELQRRTAQWARRWSVLYVACMYLDAITVDEQWQMTRLDLLQTFYTVIRVTPERSGFRVGHHSVVTKS